LIEACRRPVDTPRQWLERWCSLRIARSIDDEILSHIKARVAQLRKVLSLAHDPRMIAVLQEVIDSGETDIRRLEEQGDQPS
jgi:hypothetical protein